MSSDAEWPGKLGLPDFSVTTEFRPLGTKIISYWFCGDSGNDVRTLAKCIQQIVEKDGPEEVDESTFTDLGKRLGELDAEGKVCMAVYNTTDNAWYPLQRCAMHFVHPHYLIIDLDGDTAPNPEVIQFESRELAEKALSAVNMSVDSTVTITNGRGAPMRIQRDLIAGARISTEFPLRI
jgi:hypothetical protein